MRTRAFCELPWSPATNIANIGRLLIAVAWTITWGTARWIGNAVHEWLEWWKYGVPRWPGHPRRFAFMWGRHESPKAVICDCGWIGPLRWMVHTYQDDGAGDVECCDECPRCGYTDAYRPVFQSKKRGWTS